MKHIHPALVFLVLFSTACGGLSPALPTIDVAKAAQQTLAAVAVQPTQTPTEAPLALNGSAPASTAPLQPTPVVQPAGNVVIQPTSVLNNLKITFVDVGQGDATLFWLPDGKTILMDGGEFDAGLLPYLQSAGVSRIDLMIATTA